MKSSISDSLLSEPSRHRIAWQPASCGSRSWRLESSPKKGWPLSHLIILVFVLVMPSSHVLSDDNTDNAKSDGTNHRIFDASQQPDDPRLKKPKDLNGHFPFNVPATKTEWQQRRTRLKQRVLVANGLWPLPARTPLNAVIHGTVKRNGFTVEKVYFESLPGHFVSGLLFRPEGEATSKRPAVLSPHGHGGRQFEYDDKEMKKMLDSGAEFFPDSGRFPKIARCAHLARMGCVVFIFDMLGYVDSQQISREVAHRYKAVRPQMEGLDDYGFYSAQAEGRLHSVMGLQTWNAIRSLDFLASLPDVDSQSLAVTGGSGGGTQTILLGAIDDRPIALFPNGMVSTSMQGGCTCENCSLLRIETGNVELAALFAPKPQGMTAAKDWTVDMMRDGYPQLKQLYSMLGQPQNVICEPLLQFPHNYNAVTRKIMYQFMQEHLDLPADVPLIETDWPSLTKEESTVWNSDHPVPEGGQTYERKLLQQLADRDSDQMFQHVPTKEQLPEYLNIIRPGWETIVGRSLEDMGEIRRTKVWKKQRDGYLLVGDLLTETSNGEQLPVISVYPTAIDWNQQVVLWFSGHGKARLFPDGDLHADAKKLVDAGFAIVTADLFGQGEFTSDGQPLTMNPLVKNPRPFAGYTLGYNHSVFARRVHDVLKVVKWVQTTERQPRSIHAIAVEGAGPILAVAAIVTNGALQKTAIDTQSFRFATLTNWKKVEFLPGAIKYGDIPGALACGTQKSLWLGGETSVPENVQEVMSVDGRSSVVESPSDSETSAARAVNWLLKK